MTESLLLIAIILLAMTVMGGGTAVFCCFSYERGLPFMSIGKVYERVADLEKNTTLQYMDFVDLVNDLTKTLREEAQAIPRKIVLMDKSTVLDIDPALYSAGSHGSGLKLTEASSQTDCTTVLPSQTTGSLQLLPDVIIPILE